MCNMCKNTVKKEGICECPPPFFCGGGGVGGWVGVGKVGHLISKMYFYPWLSVISFFKFKMFITIF